MKLKIYGDSQMNEYQLELHKFYLDQISALTIIKK